MKKSIFVFLLIASNLICGSDKDYFVSFLQGFLSEPCLTLEDINNKKFISNGYSYKKLLDSEQKLGFKDGMYLRNNLTREDVWNKLDKRIRVLLPRYSLLHMEQMEQVELSREQDNIKSEEEVRAIIDRSGLPLLNNQKIVEFTYNGNDDVYEYKNC